MRSKRQSRKSSKTLTNLTHYKEDSIILNQYYQAPPPRANIREHEREHAPKKVRIDLPHFHGKEDVETYLDWEILVSSSK